MFAEIFKTSPVKSYFMKINLLFANFTFIFTHSLLYRNAPNMYNSLTVP